MARNIYTMVKNKTAYDVSMVGKSDVEMLKMRLKRLRML